jgi:hypothetical protein
LYPAPLSKIFKKDFSRSRFPLDIIGGDETVSNTTVHLMLILPGELKHACPRAPSSPPTNLSSVGTKTK